MADTYEAFYNGKPLNPNRGLPTMTYAQAENCGLTESERLWCRTDGEDTPVTADDIPYDSNNSVKDKIDGIAEQISISDTSYTIGATCYKIGKLVIISCYVVDYPANGILLTLPNDLKPSSNVSLGREWLMTDSSNWGSKEFILFPSGNIGCASAIYRGSVKLFYYTS